MTIKATRQMQDVRIRLIDEGRIKPAAINQAKRLGMTLEDMQAAADRVKMRRASLHMQGNPRAFREDDADYDPINPNDPTPQWRAKAGDLSSVTVGKGEVVPIKRYRQRHVVEQYGNQFDMSKRSALERFMQDATYGMRISVADPNRGGGKGAPGTRLGGLGNVPQHVRDGHARHEWVWGRLPLDLQRVSHALVTREVAKLDGTPFSLEDFGAEMFPSVKDRNRRWGAAAGALWSLAGALVFLYARCPVKIRARDCEALEILE